MRLLWIVVLHFINTNNINDADSKLKILKLNLSVMKLLKQIFVCFVSPTPRFEEFASFKKTKGKTKYRSPVKCSVIVAFTTWRT